MAITATLNHIQNSESLSTDNISDIVNRIKPHVYPIAQVAEWSYEQKLNKAIEANVMASVGQLSSSSRMIEELVRLKKLKIIGGVLELSSGQVRFL